jgi:hypothetical protein
MYQAAGLATTCPPIASHAPIRFRLRVAAAMLALAFTACAPDARKANPAYDAFVNKVQRACGNLSIGEPTVNDLLNQDSTTYSVYFVDLTSRWGLGKISTPDYVQGVMSVGGGRESAGLKCILAQKTQ